MAGRRPEASKRVIRPGAQREVVRKAIARGDSEERVVQQFLPAYGMPARALPVYRRADNARQAHGVKRAAKRGGGVRMIIGTTVRRPPARQTTNGICAEQ